MEHLIYILGMAIGLGIFMRYSSAASREQPSNEDGKMVLTPNKSYKISAYGFFVIGFIFGIGGLVEAIRTHISVLIIVVPVVTGIVLFGRAAMLEYKNVRVEADADEIKSFGKRGEFDSIKWSDVKWVDYVQKAASLRFMGDSNSVLVSTYLIGFSHFLELVKQHLDDSQCQRVFELLKRHTRRNFDL